MRLSENLRSIRVQRELTQDELAELCGLSKAQISRMEAGSQRNPSIETVVAIATALGVSIEELVFGAENDEKIVFGMQLKNLLQVINRLPQKNQDTIKDVVLAYVAQSESLIRWSELNKLEPIEKAAEQMKIKDFIESSKEISEKYDG